MTDHYVDRIARLLSGSRSRRQALVALGALALGRTIPAAAATQIEVAACGKAGAVCTALKGCCEGLVCATSTMNPAYGVCVTGEGDILAVSDDLVVPGSEGIEEELATQVSDAAAGAGDDQSALNAPGTRTKRSKDTTTTGTTTGTTTSTSAQSHRAQVRARKAANRLNSGDDNKSLDRKPRLTLTLSDGTASETLHVVNNNNVSVLISHIESLTEPGGGKDLNITIGAGLSRVLKSGTAEWPDGEVCSAGRTGDGVALTVTKFGAIRSHQLEALCDPTTAPESALAADSKTRKQKTPKKRRTKKQSKRGKGQ